ncbi:6-phosphofructokinase [Sedimentisphaera salicampi]|uniref:6-phosphofructokinase n=1 Tax=Sedimentisphaera salicampi TaxID=1941349 RepID=UPI000B9AA5BB|nr:ATP-dependent 6-phosphofructokinase [Sedimentisphaera salicampi]OXU16104.1 6-phosphofructokinase [Sedimentisphaera salicampi]
MSNKTKCVGILTSGGDCPGLNAAIRGVAKSAMANGSRVVGFLDGFRGLVENRTMVLEDRNVSGILTNGGTILGTSRDKPRKMPMGDQILDVTDIAVANAQRNHIDCLVCLGGNGTQKNAMDLCKKGLNVITLPKTIDNDVAETDITFGFDTAIKIATDAIDKLHTTATSHHRVIVCEIMGNKAGWLTLGAGIAGGADVILIPELPYKIESIVDHLLARRRHQKRFSIVAVAEGAISQKEADEIKENGKKKKKKKTYMDDDGTYLVEETTSTKIARKITQACGIDTRVTRLGHVQRGGSPSASDRLLCTRLGTKVGQLLAEGVYNVMVGVKNDKCVPVDLEKVAGITRKVPSDHEWLKTALLVDTNMGCELKI